MPDETRVVLVKPGEVLVFGNVGGGGSEMAEAARALGEIVGVRVVLFAGDIDMASLPVRDSAKLAYSIEEATAALSIGRTSLFDLLRRNEIASVTIGRRRIVPAASLEAYMNRLAPDGEAGG